MTANNEEYMRKNRVITIDDDKNTRLHYAAALGNVDALREELSTGQKIDPENYLGWTPLMMAVRNGHTEAVQLLLENRADATKRNKFDITVFLVSVVCGRLEILTIVLEHLFCGGISRRCMQKILSPISLAVMFGQPHVFRYLINRSFDVNAATPVTGLTPLMFAAAVGNIKAFKKLIQAKADQKQKNYLGKTANDITQSRNQRVDVILDRKLKPPHAPLIMISPHTPNSPYLQLTPYPVTNPNPNADHLRKSSNTNSQIFCSPNITPITPNFIPQVFFPPNFTPSQFVSPVYQTNDFLNAHITHSPYFSPVTQPLCYSNYV